MAYRIPFALKHSPGIQKNGRYSITLHNHHTGKPYLEDFNTALDPDHEKERDKAWPVRYRLRCLHTHSKAYSIQNVPCTVNKAGSRQSFGLQQMQVHSVKQLAVHGTSEC